MNPVSLWNRHKLGMIPGKGGTGKKPGKDGVTGNLDCVGTAGNRIAGLVVAQPGLMICKKEDFNF